MAANSSLTLIQDMLYIINLLNFHFVFRHFQLLDFFKDGSKIPPPPQFSFSEDDPNVLIPEVRETLMKAWELVQKCWSKDPGQRPKSRELALPFNGKIKVPF